MQITRPLITCVLIALILLFNVQSAFAFKLESHIWLAKQIHQEIETRNGKVRIDGRDYSLAPAISNAIRNAEGAFVMGVLGADVYPDMIAGQMTTHPGVNVLIDGELAWQTDDWLNHVISSALNDGSNEAIAFAAGYVLHAAMDMWAHTYVNLMVGDPFSIADNPETAERHVAIETYFTKFHQHPLDLYSSGNGADYLSTLRVPASFVRKTLILNPAVRKQYAAESTTLYLAAINDYVVQLLATKENVNTVVGNLNDELLELQPVIDLLELSFNGVKSAQLVF
ncbi:MAG: hypothetical protein GXP16_17225 [Gammaproteobacteria bacterium]|nr:hypothetical protein [Gammaproteobacteria bacterium]